MNLAGPRLRAVLAVLVVFAAAPRRARADAPMSNEMKAEQLFRTGKKHYDAGRFGEACASFEESLRIAPKLGTLLNLALCHEAAGKPATAWAEFHYGAAWAAQNNQLDRRDFAVERTRAIEAKLPRVALQLPAATAIAGVEIDGEPLAEQRWYLPLFLDPGEHVVAVTAPGKARSKVAFRVIASPTEQLVVIPTLADDEGAPPAKPGEARPPDPSGRRTAGWVTVGVGGALFAAGLGFGVAALSADDADVKGPATISTIAFAGAGAAAGVGLWLLLTSRPPARSAGLGVTPFGISGTF